MRWNDQGKWIYSEEIAHPPVIDDDTFRRAQELLTARRGIRGPHKPHRSKHAYALRGLLLRILMHCLAYSIETRWLRLLPIRPHHFVTAASRSILPAE
jgi:hypothetical protein